MDSVILNGYPTGQLKVGRSLVREEIIKTSGEPHREVNVYVPGGSDSWYTP
jgi:hypothetical protein